MKALNDLPQAIRSAEVTPVISDPLPELGAQAQQILVCTLLPPY